MVLHLTNPLRRATPSLRAVLCIVALVLVPSLPATAEDQPRVKLASALGVEAEVLVEGVDLDNDVIAHALWETTTGSMWSLPLKVADGVFLSVPLDMVRSVSRKNRKHAIQMSDGQELEGALFGTLVTGDGRSYDLAGVDSLTVVNAPRPTPSTARPSARQNWTLQVTGATGMAFTVVEPVFSFQYYSSSGYAFGGSDRETSTRSFFFKVKDQEFLANIDDFARLSLATAPKGAVMLTVESKTGIKNTGTLLLRQKDDEGSHEGRDDWVLSARMAGKERILVAVGVRGWSLSRRNP
jgi:hypothetical protein